MSCCSVFAVPTGVADDATDELDAETVRRAFRLRSVFAYASGRSLEFWQVRVEPYHERSLWGLGSMDTVGVRLVRAAVSNRLGGIRAQVGPGRLDAGSRGTD